jgi:TetR/AcrR family transcriptional regulator
MATPLKTRNAEATRTLILESALSHFAHDGLAGARTDAIAKEAGVNKALIHYYFKDKETLYGAAFEHVFGGLHSRLLAILSQPGDPSTKVLAYTLTHFDYLCSNAFFPALIQREMMRSKRKPTAHLARVLKKYGRPTFERLAICLAEGMRNGEVRQTDPAQVILSMLGTVIVYFTSAPGMRVITGQEPFTPPRIIERRRALVDFISHAILTEKGREKTSSFAAQTAGPCIHPKSKAGR